MNSVDDILIGNELATKRGEELLRMAHIPENLMDDFYKDRAIHCDQGYILTEKELRVLGFFDKGET